MEVTIAFQVRMSHELYRKLSSAAASQNRSASNLARLLIEREVARAEKESPSKFKKEMLSRETGASQAHALVTAAKRKGDMPRSAPCEECGQPGVAHHDDYSKPLTIRWLCRKHHRILHASKKVKRGA